MTANLASITRRASRIIIGTLLAILAFVAFLIIGWIPVELASMLASRRTLDDRVEDDSCSAPTTPVERSVRRRRRRSRRRGRPSTPLR